MATGLVPDFAYSAGGVRINDIYADSAAERAGLLVGDIIMTINGKEAVDLRTYSGMLKEHAPGDVIEIGFTRDGQDHETRLTLMER